MKVRSDRTDIITNEGLISGTLNELNHQVEKIKRLERRMFPESYWLNDIKPVTTYKCSNCKSEYFDVTDFLYCPHCGVQMDIKKEKENKE